MVSLKWQHEDRLASEGHVHVAGVDEAGRGCLAGVVVAAAVIFGKHRPLLEGLNDSKKLSRCQRKNLFEKITLHPEIMYNVASASVEEIDQLNILQASHLAMKRAVEGLSPKPQWLLVDGLPVKMLGKNQTALVGGDAISPSIAAASILAKETRDCLMEQADRDFPDYGFAQHKGYGTQAHLNAIKCLGVCALHRKSFAPVRQMALF